MTAFTDLPLAPSLLPGLDALGHTEMTPVQAQALPALLDGRDLIARAPTGSGKTLAFGLSLLQRVDASSNTVQALVLCPTRELADQVAKQLRRLATGIANLKLSTLTGGVALAPQVASLQQHPPHVVVGTPGRVQELARGRQLDLRNARILVLDEADRMLDMGFEEPIRDIVGRLPRDRQTALFSATFPEAIESVAAGVMRDPVRVEVDDTQSVPAIEQVFLETDPAQKPAALAALLLEHRPQSAVVFCNLRRDTGDVVDSLTHLGFSALALHGEMEQRDRDEAMVQFANRSCTVLVASDVAARGIDVEDVGLVVNYDVPTDPDVYTHRIGRTGRAGRQGVAATLCTPRESTRARQLAEQAGSVRWRPAAGLVLKPGMGRPAGMVTLRIDAGRTDKLRPGDIVGALTGDAGLPGDALGRIDVFPTRSYVAIRRDLAGKALSRLQEGRIKGKRFRVRRV